MMLRALALVCLVLVSLSAPAGADDFDDGFVAQVSHPAWLKESFLDLPQDCADATGAGKLGLVCICIRWWLPLPSGGYADAR